MWDLPEFLRASSTDKWDEDTRAVAEPALGTVLYQHAHLLPGFKPNAVVDNRPECYTLLRMDGYVGAEASARYLRHQLAAINWKGLCSQNPRLVVELMGPTSLTLASLTNSVLTVIPLKTLAWEHLVVCVSHPGNAARALRRLYHTVLVVVLNGRVPGNMDRLRRLIYPNRQYVSPPRFLHLTVKFPTRAVFGWLCSPEILGLRLTIERASDSANIAAWIANVLRTPRTPPIQYPVQVAGSTRWNRLYGTDVVIHHRMYTPSHPRFVLRSPDNHVSIAGPRSILDAVQGYLDAEAANITWIGEPTEEEEEDEHGGEPPPKRARSGVRRW